MVRMSSPVGGSCRSHAGRCGRWSPLRCLLQGGEFFRERLTFLVGERSLLQPRQNRGADPGFDAVARALVDALGAAAGVAPLDEDDALRADVAAWTRTFGGEEWTWRR